MLQRISHRLAALIIIAVAGLLINGISGLTQVVRLGNDINELTGNTIPSIELIDEAKITFYAVRADLLLHVIEQDPDKKQLLETSLNANVQRLHKVLEGYEAYVSDPEDKRMLAEDKAAVAAYLQVLDQVLGYSRSNDTTSSMAIATTKLRDAANATLAALDRHVKHNHHQGELTKTHTQAAVSTAKWMSVSVMLVAVFLLLWFAYTTYQKVVGTAQRARNEVIRVVEQLDFSRPFPVQGKDELAELLEALNRLITRLREGLSAVRDNAARLNRSAEEMALASHQVTASSAAQSDAASTMAASVEEVTVSISHVSDRTGEASRLTRQSGDQAVGGRDAVVRTAQRIGAISDLVDEAADELARLEESGRQISAVVSVIKEVADQTNLLALNAAIEAARAGEQGRGFAVVADEVRKLAERTANSTVEITAMVATIQQRSGEVSRRMAEAVASVREGVSEAESTRAAMGEIAQSAAQSGELVGEVATALREQSTASNEIASQVERVAQMAEENSRAAERSAELATELQRLADEMSRDVAAYRLD
ncbi:methyl-accepting chemotaxis protein [Chitinimonas sp. BJYL2]|uniref:methyl-accepting chemotaxis protein n=1 Tax=Chitinimonas sp. BJYL2 TaxID=2976696 RepID=UPI0022B3E758|nr:methyl-accepting chemotaxis protein [Chitinimonas sp. BJYL2]